MLSTFRPVVVLLISFVLQSTLRAQGKNPHVADTLPLPPSEQLKKFKLPAGFEIQLVAAEPLVKKPINIAFDARGRLWVTGSEEYPFAVPPGRKPKDTIKILSDFAADGHARKIITFADGLNIPIGVLPTSKGAIGFSIPNLYAFYDDDGDGKADRKEVMFSGYGQRDTHGLTGEFMWGFDGWIYCCHGFSNASDVRGKDRQGVKMESGNTYRIKPDGSRIEYFTHGQVNPFGLAFDEYGNLFSADCHTRPLYHLLKGAWYPSFGRPHDGLGFGPEMVTHSHGSTAIAGIACYADNLFPPEFQGNLFVGNVVTNRVNRDRVEWKGGSPRGIEMPDFIRCDDPWFRPVDIKLGPDGALYIADFYNRIIGHYEVPLNHPGRDREKGRIWRVVYRGPDGKKSLRPVADLANASLPELIQELDHPNLTVRTHATNQIVDRGPESAPDLMRMIESGTTKQKVHGLWALQRLAKLDSASLAKFSEHQDDLMRVHVQRILAERDTLPGVERALVLAGLRDRSGLVQRCAAEALGSHPSLENLAALSDFLPKISDDPQLRHVARMALRNQLRSPEVVAKLDTIHFTEAMSRTIADVCPGVHNPESAAFLVRHLDKYAEPPLVFASHARYAARFGKSGTAARLLAAGRKHYSADLTLQSNLVQAVNKGLQEAGQKLESAELIQIAGVCQNLLAAKDSGQVQAGIELAQTFKFTEAEKALQALVLAAKVPATLRKNAVVALFNMEPKKHLDTFGKLLSDSSQEIELREQLATALGGTNVADAHVILIAGLQTAPARLQTAIALALAGSPQGGGKLLQAVAQGKASARLLQEKTIAERLRQSKIPMLDQQVAKLTKGLPSRDEQVQKLLADRRNGFRTSKSDSILGAKLFAKHCAACHQLGNQGAKIGPQLDGIGIRGIERLLEDILDPSRNVDQAFRVTTLALKDGKVISGLLLRQDGKILVLADSQGKEVRVPESDLEERTVGLLSPMPANWAEILPETDFYQLLDFLLQQKVK